MKHIFSARSPFWQLSIYALFFALAILILLGKESDLNSDTVRIWTIVIASVLLLLAVGYTTQIALHNRRNPNNRIRYWGMLPPELKEEDEGMAAITAKATRRVYIFHASALPLGSIMYVLLLPAPIFVVLGLAVLLLGHFTIYWVTIWPAWSDEEE